VDSILTKPKVAFYWCSSCGGCEEAVIDLGERLLDVAGGVDIVFWPVAIDTKYDDVRNMPDGSIDICFINGAIRLSEQREMAELMRRKSKVVIAFGSCAHLGGIPGLANFCGGKAALDYAFRRTPGLANADGIIPGGIGNEPLQIAHGKYELELPAVFDSVLTLGQVIEIDYILPGCPPNPDLLMDTLQAAFEDALPERGTVLAPQKALCETCPLLRTRPEKLCLDSFVRVHRVAIDPDTCLLAQGIICLGPATRAGCGAACISAAMPCRGCYGPPEGVIDQGAKMISALSSLVDGEDAQKIAEVIDTIADPAGTFYRYGLSASILHDSINQDAIKPGGFEQLSSESATVPKGAPMPGELELPQTKVATEPGPVITGDHGKPKLAFYWCSSCGGCEETVIDLAEDLIPLTQQADIVFWPVAIDTKYDDLRAMADNSIDIAFINGAIRLSEQLEIARVLREKAKYVIAFGSCAHTGGVPGMANLSDAEEMLNQVFLSQPGLDNPGNTVPGGISAEMIDVSHNGTKMHLPGIFSSVCTLAQTIDVDYYIPGCPPTPELLKQAITAAFEDGLPPKGTVLAPGKALCEECERRNSRPETLELESFARIHLIQADPEICFLAQGIICLGPATRSGCHSACIDVNMPCRGCFGAPAGVVDQGGKMLSALSSLVGGESEEDIARVIDTIADPAGTFYRYGLPGSILGRKF
jgi:F420-non-reducing hydrogenase small subunit